MHVNTSSTHPRKCQFLSEWVKLSALAASVALALFAAGTVASSVGSLLPWLFGRFGYDPAYGSGPVATVLQDVLSLIIYFSIPSALVM
jgi:magnesium transporter